jgi:hypothetical protein
MRPLRDDDAGEQAIDTKRAPLAQQAGVSVTVYAAIAGLAGAIPLPILDSALSELARGAAMRRVAKRHGVVLTPDARAILAGPGAVGATSSERGRLLRAALSSVLAPLRIASRIEDGVATLFAAILLDHYLRRPDRPRGAALVESEARRVRAAMESAVVASGFDALKTVPLGLFRVLKDGLTAMVSVDGESRSPLERLVDTILDELADGPDELVDTLSLHFDEALDRPSGEVE